jgi:hypothetical protein
MVAEIITIGYDDVIKEVDLHQFAGAFQTSCQFIVSLARGEVA